MAFLLKDRVKETTTTTGTGSISMGGAVTGFRAFSSAFSTGDTTYYTIDGGSGEWEVGLGTLTSGTPWTMARTSVLASSNAGSAVNFSAGTKNVWCDAPAVMVSPGGSTTQVQYNNAGAFAGDSGFTYSSTNKAITLGGATVTASAPVLDLSQTWNNSGVTFTGWKLNVTDTASASASLLMDLQVGGSSKFKVDKSGNATVPLGFICGYMQVADAGGFLSATRSQFKTNSDGTWTMYNSAGTSFTSLSWYTDTILARDAANTLALRNSTSAQTFNVYNTYTDGSNYERVSLQYSANVAYLASEAAGTGTARTIAISYAGTYVASFSTFGININQSLLFPSDNTYDIGANGATRPRNGYFGGTLQFGTHSAIGAETVTGYITITDAGGTTRKIAVVS